MSKYIIRPELLNAVMMAESGGNTNAISPKNARGLFQIMPKTAANPGFGITPLQDSSPDEQRRFAGDYLGALLDKFGGNEALAVAAYNAGPGAVEKHGDIPPFRETQSYVAKIGRMLSPMASAQAEDKPQVTVDSPMQYPNSQSELDKASAEWDALDSNQNDLKAASDEWDALEPKRQDQGYALPNFLSGTGASILKQAGALSEYLGANEGAKNLYEASKQGEQDAPGMAGSAGKFLGDIMPYMVAPEIKAAGNLPLYGKIGQKLLNAYGIQGGTAYALTPGSDEERTTAANVSALGSLAAPLITGGLGNLIKGFVPSQEAANLMKRGVVPTVGQGIEQKGLYGLLGKSIRKTEEAMSSIPILGSIGQFARGRADDDWVKSVMNGIDIPAGQITIKGSNIPVSGVSAGGKTGYEAIDALKSSFSNAYDDTLKNVVVPVKPSIKNYFDDIINDPKLILSPSQRDAVRRSLASSYDTLGQGMASAQKLKLVYSDLFKQGASRMKSPLASEQSQGKALQNAAYFLRDYMDTYLPKSVSDKMAQLDSKYGEYQILKEAVGSKGAAKNYGNISGNQLLSAVRNQDKKIARNAFDTGQAKLQQDAIDSINVLSNTLSESGTAPRLMTAGLLTGAAYPYFPALASSVIAGGIGATRPVQKALLGGYKWQHSLANVIDKYVTKKAPHAGAGLGYYLYDQSR